MYVLNQILQINNTSKLVTVLLGLSTGDAFDKSLILRRFLAHNRLVSHADSLIVHLLINVVFPLGPVRAHVCAHGSERNHIPWSCKEIR